MEKRELIERGLNERKTFTFIAQEIGASVSTVRREILRNRRYDGASYSKGADRTDCAHLHHCKIKSICDHCYANRLCKRCAMLKCQDICADYESRSCPTVVNAPFVCNSCDRYGRCTTIRYRYSAVSAQALAGRRSTDARSGIDLTEDEAGALVDAVRSGLSKGQSIHHIFESNGLPCSERSFYRYVENQDIPIKSIDLHKKVKYKKRKRAKVQAHGTGFFAGHEYEDFLALPEDDRAAATEMDTVHGKKGDHKCILSLHRVDLHFQIYILLPDCTMQSVVDALDWLEERCDGHFNEFFGLLLMDRGSEFDDISGIEMSAFHSVKRCSAYFADPNRPDQKGACEKNHVELRKILPKGTSFKKMDAATLSLICSHVNSTIRKGCGNATPFRLASLCAPDGLLGRLGLRLIPPMEVIAAPNILYKPD
jgi:IS30 family transposase